MPEQPTIPALRNEYTAYAIGEGGVLSYLRWLECRAVTLQIHLNAYEECIDDIAEEPPSPVWRKVW